jgi:dipeptidyl aminopeptidase/acylaminoacyl peptidase
VGIAEKLVGEVTASLAGKWYSLSMVLEPIVGAHERAPRQYHTGDRAVKRAIALVFLVLSAWAPGRAGADERVWMLPGGAYVLEWQRLGAPPIRVNPRVARAGWTRVDRWLQVAPGGGALALFGQNPGLLVYAASGEELLREPRGVTAFRFSPNGQRLAFTSAKGLEVYDIDRRERRFLARLHGIDLLRWTDAGVVARRGGRLILVNDAGKQRRLASAGRLDAVVAAGTRVVYFERGMMVSLDIEGRTEPVRSRLETRDPVTLAELSPDGVRLLYATAKRAYLADGSGTPRVVANEGDLHSLSFAPDGSAYVWASRMRGALECDGDSQPLPLYVTSARFRQDGAGVVVTRLEKGVATWMPDGSEPKLIGGVSPDDGGNWTGDVIGDEAVAFYGRKDSRTKRHEVPYDQRPDVP